MISGYGMSESLVTFLREPGNIVHATEYSSVSIEKRKTPRCYSTRIGFGWAGENEHEEAWRLTGVAAWVNWQFTTHHMAEWRGSYTRAQQKYRLTLICWRSPSARVVKVLGCNVMTQIRTRVRSIFFFVVQSRLEINLHEL